MSDGTNTYSWNSRNQLSSITGPVNASFLYDAMGRRMQKTVAAVTTGYLYDGSNFAQEQNGSGVVTAALLTGGVDEILARMTSAGVDTPLTDALGSVIAETNAAQAVTTDYGYEPYGNTSLTGTITENTQQYTGRENDGTGLYYYRARYFSPLAARFMSEDPIGFAGGNNLYTYVGGNPTNYVDPYGLLPWNTFWQEVILAWQFITGHEGPRPPPPGGPPTQEQPQGPGGGKGSGGSGSGSGGSGSGSSGTGDGTGDSGDSSGNNPLKLIIDFINGLSLNPCSPWKPWQPHPGHHPG